MKVILNNVVDYLLLKSVACFKKYCMLNVLKPFLEKIRSKNISILIICLLGSAIGGIGYECLSRDPDISLPNKVEILDLQIPVNIFSSILIIYLLFKAYLVDPNDLYSDE